MHLSERMKMVAGMVTPCTTLADVGCDHGYLSIWLLRHGVCEKAIAMDLREGPLLHAQANRSFFHMEERMELRLSDGLQKLSPGEADAIVLAGMGGQLVMDILDRSPDCAAVAQMVLQPQSEIPEVRKYLHRKGFRITGEEMCLEDGKYYTAMRAEPGTEPPYSEEEYLAGKCLLEVQHPVAAAYIKLLTEKRRRVLEQLVFATPEKVGERLQSAREELRCAERALERLQ